MGLTKYPNGISSFGAPVSGSRFDGWWGNDIWFVDFDNGLSGDSGSEMAFPQKDLTVILDKAGAGDTIFMRPRTTVPSVGSNNEVITPATAANWVIAQGQHDLSIIGTSRNQGLTHGVMLQTYALLTTPTLDVLAPYCTLENLGFKSTANTSQNVSVQESGLVRAEAKTAGTEDGFGLTIDNCQFNVYWFSNGAAVTLNSGRYNRVLNSDFWHCRVGIVLYSGEKNIQGNQIVGCNFYGLATDIDADINVADATHLLIDDCTFDHAVPNHTSGNIKKYIRCYGTVYGSVVNCRFGTSTVTKGTDNSFSSMDVMGNVCSFSDNYEGFATT